MTDQSTSSRPDMGAVPRSGGIVFRVWAPHAEHVYAAGTFNNWSETKTPLTRESGGFWSGEVKGANPNDQYRYIIEFGGKKLSRNDPYARDVTSSTGNSIIHATTFDWGNDRPFERLRSTPWSSTSCISAPLMISRAGRRAILTVRFKNFLI